MFQLKTISRCDNGYLEFKDLAGKGIIWRLEGQQYKHEHEFGFEGFNEPISKKLLLTSIPINSAFLKSPTWFFPQIAMQTSPKIFSSMESLTSNLTGSLWGLPFPHQLIKL
jgi:hypothetical protein